MPGVAPDSRSLRLYPNRRVSSPPFSTEDRKAPPPTTSTCLYFPLLPADQKHERAHPSGIFHQQPRQQHPYPASVSSDQQILKVLLQNTVTIDLLLPVA
ncbi:hypothetical protein E3U43_022205 [Larimichthys crocea]|uniref:Uncharacterized protein n=1 Tax=Larimichthys crocea TaxID=215358 RepID=A0ACD3R2V0_LARCR|nr:hypothetical protein E3U43_022205 [Larimichthys crocea]